MNNQFNFKVKIFELFLEFNFDNYQNFKWVSNEFRLNISNDCLEPNLIINFISSKKFYKRNLLVKQNLILYNDHVFQKIKGHLRKTYIDYVLNKNKICKILVYFSPKSKSKFVQILTSLLSSNGCSSFQNSIIDFIHGPLLGIINFELLKFNSMLFHSAAFTKNNNTYLISGFGQSGKSSFMDFIDKLGGTIVAEDFCAVKDNKVIGIQKMKKMSLNLKICDTFFCLTFVFFKIIFNKIFGERFFYVSTFHDSYKNIAKIPEMEISKIFFLNRLKTGNAFNKNNCSSEIDVKKIIHTMMLQEYENMNGFIDLIETLSTNKLINYDFKDLQNKIINNIFDWNKIEIIDIPEFADLNSFNNFIKSFFTKI